jgi:hypothetical protein
MGIESEEEAANLRKLRKYLTKSSGERASDSPYIVWLRPTLDAVSQSEAEEIVLASCSSCRTLPFLAPKGDTFNAP